MRNKQKRIYEWSANIAYSVGLMASDGCLQLNGRHLDLTSVDVDQLRNFQKALGRELTIGKKLSAGHLAYRIQFSDVAYYDFLLDAGLTPRKSKTLSALNIPDNYYSHFLRGVFDGDGTTYGYYDPRWPTSFLFYIGIASASDEFLDYIRTTNTRLFGIGAGSIRRSSRARTIGYAKVNSYKLFNVMYSEASCLHLQRKKQKLEQFIKYDHDATIKRRARVVKSVNTLA